MKKYILIFFTVFIITSVYGGGGRPEEEDTSMVPNAKKIIRHDIFSKPQGTHFITEYYPDGTMYKKQYIYYDGDYKAKDTRMYNTKGQRIFYENTVNRDIKNDTSVITSLGIYEFDALGNVTKEELVYPDGDFSLGTSLYEYNADGQITVEKEYHTLYDENGNLIPEYVTQYIYDENKNLIEKKFDRHVSLREIQIPGSSFYYYDGVIRTLTYPYYGLKDPKNTELIWEEYSDDYLPIKEITIYENRFLKYRMYTFGSEAQFLPETLEEKVDATSIYEITYDERGNQLLFTCYTADMSKIWYWYEYAYSNYDAQGNWTKRIIRNGDTGSIHCTTTRSIEYWSDSELEGGNAQRATIYNAIHP